MPWRAYRRDVLYLIVALCVTISAEISIKRIYREYVYSFDAKLLQIRGEVLSGENRSLFERLEIKSLRDRVSELERETRKLSKERHE